MKQKTMLVTLNLQPRAHIFSVWQMGTWKALCSLPKFPGCLEKRICAAFELWAKWAAFFFFCKKHYFYLKLQFIDKLWLFRLGYVAELFSKINDMSLSLQEHDWQYLLLMIKIWASSKIRVLGNLYLPLWAGQLYHPPVKTLLKTLVVMVPNVIFGCCIMKCISIWEKSA